MSQSILIGLRIMWDLGTKDLFANIIIVHKRTIVNFFDENAKTSNIPVEITKRVFKYLHRFGSIKFRHIIEIPV